MVTKSLIAYNPDYAVSPGEILEETLEARGILKSELAGRCQLSAKHISQIISGKAPVTPETALQLERVLGVSARLWGNLETNYQLFKKRRENQNALALELDWLKSIPANELVRRQLIIADSDKGVLAESILQFFGVGSIAAYEAKCESLCVCFRQSPAFTSQRGALMTWLQIGENESSRLECAPYEQGRFIQTLTEIRQLTVLSPEDFYPRMVKLCGDSGVALVMVEELPGTHIHGAARWLNQHKALIQLSLRGKRNDLFWFSFFHEAAHILKGGRKRVFVDEDNGATGEDEQIADQLAREILIPKAAWTPWVRTRQFLNATAIQAFAREIGINPGIVVGRLQHEKLIGFQRLNAFKQTYVLKASAN